MLSAWDHLAKGFMEKSRGLLITNNKLVYIKGDCNSSFMTHVKGKGRHVAYRQRK